MRVAIVHYWLVNMRGGEKVVEALCELFPEADLYTHVYEPAAVSDTLRGHRVRTTFIDRLPLAKRLYKRYLPLMPLALEQLDLRGYDLVISSESGPAKGVITAVDTPHVCYCHTPMRYLWDMYHEYRERSGPLTRLLMVPLAHRLRQWDLASAFRVDHFVANSRFVARRIRKHYRREAEVVHPPVDTEGFRPVAGRGQFYLMVGELVPYKRPDLAVAAFSALGEDLVVIGDGEMLPALRRTAGPRIRFLGRQPFEVLREHYARCRALVFPGEEDFGIVPVEAMASGRPVIAYGSGGVLDSVVDGETGVLFGEQSVASLIGAVQRYEELESRFNPERLTEHAGRFGRERFKAEMRELLERELAKARAPADGGREGGSAA